MMKGKIAIVTGGARDIGRQVSLKLAAAGATFAEAGPATLTETLSFNGVLRANQETVVQVTPRFPGIVRSMFTIAGGAGEFEFGEP